MRNPDMVYLLKMEYISKINIFGLKMMVKSGLEKIFFVIYVLGQAIGPLWGFCAPISIVVEL